MVTYCFDLDETLFRTIGTDYSNSTPIKSRMAIVRKLAEEGHTIKLYTARGTETGIDWRKITVQQLRDNDIPYVELSFGKPSADIYVDDKAVSDLDFFRDK